MKKPLAITLLTVGGAAVLTLIAFLAVVVFVVLSMFIKEGGEWALYTLAAMFVFALSYLGNHPRNFFKKKYNVNAVVFTLCVCAPSVIASLLVYLLHTPNPTGENGTDPVQIWLLFWVLSTGIFTVGMIIRAAWGALMDKAKHV